MEQNAYHVIIYSKIPINNAKKWISDLFWEVFGLHKNVAKLKILSRYIIVLSFINIGFEVVNLKIFKVLRINSASMK